MRSWDASVYRAVNRLADRTGWAHGAFVAYAKFGVVIFALLLLVGWWNARRRSDLDSLAGVVWAGVATLLAVGVNQIVGGLVERARPYTVMPDVHVLVSRTSDFSFPSDHAVAVGAVAAGLFLANRRLGSVAIGLAVLMAVARVYVGAHYPADVVAGLALGALVACLGALVGVRLLRALVGAVDRSPLRVLTSASD